MAAELRWKMYQTVSDFFLFNQRKIQLKYRTETCVFHVTVILSINSRMVAEAKSYTDGRHRWVLCFSKIRMWIAVWKRKLTVLKTDLAQVPQSEKYNKVFLFTDVLYMWKAAGLQRFPFRIANQANSFGGKGSICQVVTPTNLLTNQSMRWLLTEPRMPLTRLSLCIYLLSSPGAASRAVRGALGGGGGSGGGGGGGGGRRAAGCHLRVDVFCHVDAIVQQHLLPHAGRESRGGVPVPRLRQLLQASPAAAPAVGLQAAGAWLDAATAAMRGQEGWYRQEGRRGEGMEGCGKRRSVWYTWSHVGGFSYIWHFKKRKKLIRFVSFVTVITMFCMSIKKT